MNSNAQSVTFIAMRLLRPDRNNFGSLTVLMSISGVVLGVAALVVVMSTMNGFEKEVRSYAIGISSHGILFDRTGKLDNWQSLQAQIEATQMTQSISPFISQGAMVNTNGRIKSVIVEGIIPNLEDRVTNIKQFSRDEAYKLLNTRKNAVLIGQGLALKLQLSIGDDLSIMLPRWDEHGNFVAPSFKKLQLIGLINTGMADYDNRILMTSLETAQRLFSAKGSISGFRVKLASADDAPNVLQQITQHTSSDLSTIDWTEYNYQFFQAIQSQKRILFVVLMLIVAISSFSIASNILLTVHKKAGAIGILKSLGASKLRVALIFLLHGSMIGLLGAFLGVSLGLLLSLNANSIIEIIGALMGRQLVNPDVYLIDHLPTWVRISDVATIFLSCVLLSIIASVYPAYRASSVHPAEVLGSEN
jgi:lipoprotein-releasing system permease protein